MPKTSYSSILKNGDCLFKTINSKRYRICKVDGEILKSKPLKGRHSRDSYILKKGSMTKIPLVIKKSKRKSPKSKSNKRSKKSNKKRSPKISQMKSSKKSQKSGCVKQDLKKYKTRNSPAYPANKCCGIKKKGNDKTMYVSKKKGSSCRWMKMSKK